MNPSSDNFSPASNNQVTSTTELTDVEIQKLFEEKTKSVLFAFDDEILALEHEIQEVKHKHSTEI